MSDKWVAVDSCSPNVCHVQINLMFSDKTTPLGLVMVFSSLTIIYGRTNWHVWKINDVICVLFWLITVTINHVAISISHYTTPWIPSSVWIPLETKQQVSFRSHCVRIIINAKSFTSHIILPNVILSFHLMQEFVNTSCKMSNTKQASLFALLNKYINSIKAGGWLMEAEIDCTGSTKPAWQLIDNLQWNLWLMCSEQTADVPVVD